MPEAVTSDARSIKPESDSDSNPPILLGRRPDQLPPRVVDFEELEKKALDVLVDALKYIATTCGIVIAVYSQTLREYLKVSAIANRPLAQVTVFLPLLLWFASIIATVVGIYPREYKAETDLQKENAIKQLRTTKRRWLKWALVPFLGGFTLFVVIIAAQVFSFFPFR